MICFPPHPPQILSTQGHCLEFKTEGEIHFISLFAGTRRVKLSEHLFSTGEDMDTPIKNHGCKSTHFNDAQELL